MRRMLTLVALLVLAGCASQEYAGKTYAPTDAVRVFYDAAKVPPGYAVFGDDRAEATADHPADQIVIEIVRKAKTVGADAVLIEGVKTVEVGNTSTPVPWSDDDTEFFASPNGQLHMRHTASGEWYQNSHRIVQRETTVTAKFLRKSGG